MSRARGHCPDKSDKFNCHDKTLITRRGDLNLTCSNICANGPAIKVRF